MSGSKMTWPRVVLWTGTLGLKSCRSIVSRELAGARLCNMVTYINIRSTEILGQCP